ncbi:MAG TPA: hypothetical protein VF246_05865 [Acidimicrobiia bacterium]
MSDLPDRDRLIDLLNDERARRAWAESQLAAEKEKTKIWRRRAEERAAEIRRLRWRRSARRGTPPAQQPSTRESQVSPTPATRRPPLYPTILAAVCDPPSWADALFDVVDVDDPSVMLEAADVVIVGSDRALDRLQAWLQLPARPPLILTTGVNPEVWAPFVHPTDLAIGHVVGQAAHMPPQPVIEALPPIESVREWTTLEGGAPLERVVELAARGIPLKMAGDAVVPAGAEALVGRGDLARQAVLGRLRSHSAFGLAAFARRLGDHVRLPMPDMTPTVAALLVTNRPSRVAEALETVTAFRYPRIELMLGLHGDGFDLTDLSRRLEKLEDVPSIGVKLLRFPDEMSLGECLNCLAEGSGAQVLAKIDDDDMYGPWYLDEAVDVLQVSGADLVGKATYAVAVESRDELLLQSHGKENAEVGYVPGASFVMRRHTWEQVPFAHRRSRVDSTVIRGLRARGMTIWSSSRFEFVVRRSASGHTWQVSDELLSAQGERIGAISEWRSMLLEQQSG